MHIEKTKEERFVSVTGLILQSSRGSDWMPQGLVVKNGAPPTPVLDIGLVIGRFF